MLRLKFLTVLNLKLSAFLEHQLSLFVTDIPETRRSHRSVYEASTQEPNPRLLIGFLALGK